MRSWYAMGFVIVALLGFASWSSWKIARLENALTLVASPDYLTTNAAFDKLSEVTTNIRNEANLYQYDSEDRSPALSNIYENSGRLRDAIWKAKSQFGAEAISAPSKELTQSYFKELVRLNEWCNGLYKEFEKYKKDHQHPK